MSEAVQNELIRVETGEGPGRTIEFGQAIERPGGRETDYLASHELPEGARLFIATDTGYRSEGGDSFLANRAILESLKKSPDLEFAILATHKKLLEARKAIENRPVGVAAGIVLVRQDKADLALAGSTQALLVSKGEIKRFVSSGDPFPLGVPNREPQISQEEIPLQDGDLVILATDGVSVLEDEEILQTIQENEESSLEDIAKALTQKAVEKVASDPISLGIPPDNASAFVVRAGEKPAVPERTWENAVYDLEGLFNQVRSGINLGSEEAKRLSDRYLSLKEELGRAAVEGRLKEDSLEYLSKILAFLDRGLGIEVK